MDFIRGIIGNWLSDFACFPFNGDCSEHKPLLSVVYRSFYGDIEKRQYER